MRERIDREKFNSSVISACGEFIEITSKFEPPLKMLRGVKASELLFFENLRLDRKPRNMPTAVHILADNWFLQEFGVRFRSQAFFCTGDDFIAQHYGEIYKVYPQDGFRFCWSAKIKDLYTEVSMRHINDYNANEVIGLLEEGAYSCEDLAGAIRSDNEIMLHSDVLFHEK